MTNPNSQKIVKDLEEEKNTDFFAFYLLLLFYFRFWMSGLDNERSYLIKLSLHPCDLRESIILLSILN